ncbi:uncharacterized protein [Fopius arisanus]|uniref:Uncharacterized protein n=1 Tax=Fopius arisanus TaxID=64838 RepID=A0A9R1T1Z1_9HYME|nr:PREDICTED: uncharacterized protein LOC105265448 [Fopius arisanus]
MVTKIRLLVFLVVTILSDQLQSQPEVDWFESLSRFPIHTALIMRCHGTGDSEILKDKLLAKIMKTLPSVTLHVDHPTILLTDLDVGGISKLSTSLLFIYDIEYSGDNQKIYEVIDSIQKLADFSVNCYLLIILRTSSNFNGDMENILRHAWHHAIMHIAIVEIRHASNLNVSTKIIADSPKSLELTGAITKISKGNPDRVIIHQFNPFMKKFYHIQFSTEEVLFPNFAKNMYGLALKIIIVNQPPFASVIWNNVGDMVKMSGPNIILMQTIIEKINATPVILPKQKLSKIWRNEFTVEDIIKESFNWDLTAHLCIHYTEQIIEESVRTHNIIIHELAILMPRKLTINKKILMDALESSVLAMIIIIVVGLAVKLLKFDQRYWNLLTIFRWIFSIAVQHQPSKNYERILFFVVIVLGFTYANNIYASLTDLGVDPLVENTYETLEDVDASGLIPVIRNPVFRKTFENATDTKLNLKKRSLIVMDNTNCPEMAVRHRNVSCILFRNEAKYYKHRTRTQSGQFQLKLAKPIFWSHNAAFLFRQSLPGKKNINEIIERCREAGLLHKWYSDMTYSQRSEHTNTKEHVHVEEEQVRTLRGQLITVIVFGHSLATLTFIVEIVFHRFKTKRNFR